MAIPKLFTPLKIRGVQLKNRIVLSPMLTYAANRGELDDWHFSHLAKYAVGGVGLVFVESTKVDPRGCSTPNDLGLWKDEFIAPMKRLTSMLHRYGAAAGIQLAHSGRKARCTPPWLGRNQLPDRHGVDGSSGWELIGPSAVAHGPGYHIPRAMTKSDIDAVVGAWGGAAQRALQAGFDVIEIHAAHGYLLHQFLSPTANRRQDEYGGSLRNRMRIAIEVVGEVRRRWPADKPLFFRCSAVDGDGWTLEDTVALARALKDAGVDVVDCSSGGMNVPMARHEVGLGYQVPYAAGVRHGADIMTMAVGLILHADQAEAILASDQADLIAIGRELLQNPHWALDAAVKLGVRDAYRLVPPAYGYWLEKRAKDGFAQLPSTSSAGLDALWMEPSARAVQS